jgi:hypothetical protein
MHPAELIKLRAEIAAVVYGDCVMRGGNPNELKYIREAVATAVLIAEEIIAASAKSYSARVKKKAGQLELPLDDEPAADAAEELSP